MDEGSRAGGTSGGDGTTGGIRAACSTEAATDAARCGAKADRILAALLECPRSRLDGARTRTMPCGEVMKKVFGFGLAVSLVVLLTMPATAAAEVTVTGESTRSITVEIEEAPVAAVLENLRARFGFELDGTEKAAD